nr:unnamed protein product [Callosobruchus analis]
MYLDETSRWTSHVKATERKLSSLLHPACFRFPVHHLALTEKNVEYSCIKIFSHLPWYLKIVTNFTTFKKKIHKMLIDLEPYCLEDYFK